jgi:hypothetical protein
MSTSRLVFVTVIEKHGQNPKDDTKLRPIVCLIEGIIQNILLHFDEAQNVRMPIARSYQISLSLVPSATKKL